MIQKREIDSHDSRKIMTPKANLSAVKFAEESESSQLVSCDDNLLLDDQVFSDIDAVKPAKSYRSSSESSPEEEDKVEEESERSDGSFENPLAEKDEPSCKSSSSLVYDDEDDAPAHVTFLIS